MMEADRITYLLARYDTDECTLKERAELMAIIRSGNQEPALLRFIETQVLRADSSLRVQIEPMVAEQILDRIELHLPPAKEPARIHFLKTSWFRYAAVLLLIAGTATFVYLNYRPQKEILVQQSLPQPDIQPGGNRALLTLSDGSTIVLDSAAIGNLAEQGNTKILKLHAGSLAYQAGTSTGAVLYNTVTTPTGGQYQIVLPDGSKAWINAASSIRFPTTFTKDRKVTITGEVYLEIAPDKTKPFFVSTNDMEVQVLGTSFNVNAYDDEPTIKTTLIEGSIKVLKKTQPNTRVILKPGQQAIFKENITLNKTVDVEQAIAWKNGVFNFNGATLEEFMRQLSRWYDLKVIYQGEIPRRTFKGEMGRDLKLSQIMEMLTLFKIKYKREGTTITIESQ